MSLLHLGREARVSLLSRRIRTPQNIDFDPSLGGSVSMSLKLCENNLFDGSNEENHLSRQFPQAVG